MRGIARPGQASGRSVRPHLLRMAYVLPILLLTRQTCPAAGAEDGRALLQKTMAAYQAMQGYEGRANLSIQTMQNGKPVEREELSVAIAFKRPNRLKIQGASKKGSLLVVADGKELLTFDGATSYFTRDPVAPTLASMLPQLQVRAGVSAALDPLYFLAKDRLPKDLSAVRVQKKTTYNGRPATILTGVTQTKAQQVPIAGRKKPLVIPGSTLYWTWWIDSESSLLQRIEMRTPAAPVTIKVPQGNRLVARTVKRSVYARQIIVQAVPNAAPTDSSFAIQIPAGATPRPRSGKPRPSQK